MRLCDEEGEALAAAGALLRRAGDIVHAVAYPNNAERSPLEPELASELFDVLAAVSDAELHLARALRLDRA